MHNQIRAYVQERVHLLQGRVLEVGAREINGTVADLFPDRVGVDMEEGPGVTFVCRAEELPKHFRQGEFDAVVSCDAFEHIKDWRGAVRGMWHVLKDGGYLLMTMAGKQKGRHGYPDDYWRCDWEHVLEIFPDAEDMTSLGVSMGWIVKKQRPLPELETIELLKV